MGFNAHWALEELCSELDRPLLDVLLDLQRDFSALVRLCPTYRLGIQPGGNFFCLFDRDGRDYNPCSLAGLYAIFTTDALVYFGEASDLCRRQLRDPDNTADSTKTFTNQGRAVLKLLLHRGWAEQLSFSPLFMQLYAADASLDTKQNRSFEECYRVSRYSKALEGALSLFAPRYHKEMLARASLDHAFGGSVISEHRNQSI